MTVTVSTTRSILLSSAAAAAVALPLWAGTALAQDAQGDQTQQPADATTDINDGQLGTAGASQDQGGQQETQGTDQTQQSQDTQAQGTDQAQQSDQSQQAQQSGDAGQGITGQASGGQQGQGQGQTQVQGQGSDTLIATVGDAEIRNSDLMRAIGALPPQLGAQPPQIVMATALEQLLLREAFVQQARSQGLAQDPEVQSLVETATQAAEEDALLRVWLQRELQNRVTPEAVDRAYAGLQAVAGDQPVPPLEQIRGQIQQRLEQQAVRDLGASLLSAQVTLYGPDGQPMNQQGNAGGQGAAGTGQSGDAAGDQARSRQDTSGDQAQAQQTAAGSQPTTITATESQEHGQYLVDGEGRALYMFTADNQGQGDAEAAVSNCHDACAEAWPPLLAQGRVRIGEMLRVELFDSITRQDGSTQITYNGWPLYYYVQDQGEGQATGQDVHAHGGEWYLLRPSGERVGRE